MTDDPDAPPSVGEAVEVYRNLSNQYDEAYSIRSRERDHRRVIDRANIVLLGDVSFDVQPAGVEQIQETGVKTVCAFARGTLLSTASRDDPSPIRSSLANDWMSVEFDPLDTGLFVTADGPVEAAEYVSCTSIGDKTRLRAYEPTLLE